MMFIWMDVYRGGFAWESDPSTEFNIHPLLMTFGLVFLYGNGKTTVDTRYFNININTDMYSKYFIMYLIGILIYRIFRDGKKVNAKIGHAVIMILALLSAVVALKAVFDSHNLVDPPTNNLYTLHSWVGICTVALFSFQVANCGLLLYQSLSFINLDFIHPLIVINILSNL